VGRSSGSTATRAARPGVFVQTPRSDLFVVMLGIALGAIVLSCLLMFLIWGMYGFQTSVSALWAPTPPALQQAVSLLT
jgi:hypothetical protein